MVQIHSGVPIFERFLKVCKHEGCTNEATFGNQCQPCRNSIARYGLTTPQKLELWERQNRLCAICANAIAFNGSLSGAVVDHDHNTGVVRGILCTGCNAWLGFMEGMPKYPCIVDRYLQRNSLVTAEQGGRDALLMRICEVRCLSDQPI